RAQAAIGCALLSTIHEPGSPFVFVLRKTRLEASGSACPGIRACSLLLSIRERVADPQVETSSASKWKRQRRDREEHQPGVFA
ncbi:hypothetical protein NDU88_001201, partial [Pleurodeles waltl]